MAMQFWSLDGLTPYESARELQQSLVDLRARDLIPDTVLFLEHEPVVTRGRGLQFTGAAERARARHMPLASPLPTGVDFAESERGGDLTYHGPGQLVIYPICKLDGTGFGVHHDIASFLRRFEQVFIDEIREMGRGSIQAEARENATGVWVRPMAVASEAAAAAARDNPVTALSPARKVASMGIAVRRWVTYHGLAINCVNDLSAFQMISPCGYSPDVMTRLLDLLDPQSVEAPVLRDWQVRGRTDFESRIARRLGILGAARSAEVLKLSIEHALRIAGRLIVGSTDSVSRADAAQAGV